MKNKEKTPLETLRRLKINSYFNIDKTYVLEYKKKIIIAPNPDHKLGTRLYNLIKREFKIDEPHLKRYDFKINGTLGKRAKRKTSKTSF